MGKINVKQLHIKKQTGFKIPRGEKNKLGTDRFEYYLTDKGEENSSTPIQDFVLHQKSRNTVAETARRKRIKESKEWQDSKIQRFTELTKKLPVAVTNEDEFENSVTSGPYEGTRRVFKPSFRQHSDVQMKLDAAEKLGNWDNTHEILASMNRKKLAIPNTKFHHEYIHFAYGEKLTYADNKKDRHGGKLAGRQVEPEKKQKFGMDADEEVAWSRRM